MNKRLFLLLTILLLSVPTQSLLAATTANDELIEADPFADEDSTQLQVYDPIEPVNRGIFWVNDKLYFYLFKPIAKGWRVVPEPARVSVGKAFNNLSAPARIVNSLLQFKLESISPALHRFIVNSIVGLGGLFDPATKLGIPAQQDEDLGQTFGHYGIGSGPYLMLPILGPSNLRDGIGLIGDSFLYPLNYSLRSEEVLAARFVDAENELSLDKDTYEGIKKHEIDPYLFIRNAYEQRRAGKISE